MREQAQILNNNRLKKKITSKEVQIINEWNPELEKFYESNYLVVNKNYLENFKHNFYYFNNKNTLQIVQSFTKNQKI